jgi:hypothetical protein
MVTNEIGRSPERQGKMVPATVQGDGLPLNESEVLYLIVRHLRSFSDLKDTTDLLEDKLVSTDILHR